MLTLFEELFLLSIHEEKGTVIPWTTSGLRYGLSGAMLMELALLGKVRVDESHKLELLNADSTGDEILDKALVKFQEPDRFRKVAYWLNLFSQKSGRFRQRLAERLVAKGVFRQDDGRLEWVIPYGMEGVDPDGSAKYALKTRLRSQVLACSDAQLRPLALVNLIGSCDLMDLVFTRDERKTARHRIYELLLGAALRDPLAQAVEEIGAAVGNLVAAD